MPNKYWYFISLSQKFILNKSVHFIQWILQTEKHEWTFPCWFPCHLPVCYHKLQSSISPNIVPYFPNSNLIVLTSLAQLKIGLKLVFYFMGAWRMFVFPDHVARWLGRYPVCLMKIRHHMGDKKLVTGGVGVGGGCLGW